MAVPTADTLATYFEALARKERIEPPTGYGYKGDLALGVGAFVDDRTGCKVLEKPVVIPTGSKDVQGYMIFFAYAQEEGVIQLLDGNLPGILPATIKEPKMFPSLEAIAENFGAKDPAAAAANSKWCVALRVPIDCANQAELEGRDIWMVDIRQHVPTRLLQAAKEGDEVNLKLALEHVSSGEIVDEHGVSALMMSAFAGSVECCQVLLDKGAEVNYAEPFSLRTPLMFAAQGGFDGVVGQLLAAQADPAKVDKEGHTPLMWAAVAGKASVVRMLKGVSPIDAENPDGFTALQLAQKMNHKDCEAALA